MNPKRVVIVGGSGFIGSAIANRLCEAGVTVLIPTRRRSRAGHVLLLPNAEVVEADVHDPAALARLFEDADAVINTVGVLHSRPGTPFGPDFARAHVELPQKIVTACRTAGVARLVHISALGADANGPSEYQRSKAAGMSAAWSIARWKVSSRPASAGAMERIRPSSTSPSAVSAPVTTPACASATPHSSTSRSSTCRSSGA